MFKKIYNHRFLFSELVKRDFQKKYKGTALGMLWSMFSPLLLVLAQSIIFTHFFGETTPHFVVYMFCGNLMFSYFREATVTGMESFESNASIITKIKVPKYLFLFSKNISALINLLLSLVIFFIFCVFDKVAFTWRFFLIPFPIICLLAFNLGVGMILSIMFVFFKDIKYLYDLFCTVLVYFSAIFYNTNSYPPEIAYLFYANPIYAYITYMRKITIYAETPSLQLHLLCIFYAAIVLIIGALVYKEHNKQLLYYL